MHAELRPINTFGCNLLGQHAPRGWQNGRFGPRWEAMRWLSRGRSLRRIPPFTPTYD